MNDATEAIGQFVLMNSGDLKAEMLITDVITSAICVAFPPLTESIQLHLESFLQSAKERQPLEPDEERTFDHRIARYRVLLQALQNRQARQSC